MQAIRLTIVIGILTIGVFAAETVGNITSAGTFSLRGVPVKTEGVPSWPMVVGDELTTSASAASIQFADGSRVTLAQKSKAAVTKKDGVVTLRLVSGAMEFKRASGSTLVLLNNNTPVPGANGTVTTTAARGAAKPIMAGRPLPPPPTSTP
jgi:hypothetical protein